jgi:hypothetical protein
MLKAPVPSITVVKQHWAQSVLGWVTAYKRVNHTKDWLALLLDRCCIASWGIDPDAPWRRDAWLYGTPRWVLAQTRQEACDRPTTVMRPSVTGWLKWIDTTSGNGSTTPTGNGSTAPTEMDRQKMPFFVKTGNGSTLFSAHWKWIDTFFLLTGNGSTHVECVLLTSI